MYFLFVNGNLKHRNDSSQESKGIKVDLTLPEDTNPAIIGSLQEGIQSTLDVLLLNRSSDVLKFADSVVGWISDSVIRRKEPAITWRMALRLSALHPALEFNIVPV